MKPFDHLLGNTRVKELLEKGLKEQTTPSTLLFSGPDGIGKALFAVALAKSLLKTDKKDPVDLYHFYPEGKLYLHPIESMRFLKDEVYKPPFTSPCKVFIIHEADRMLPTSANALLKTLEEPTEGTYLILLTSKKEALLPTTLSRCNIITFLPLTDLEVIAFLTKEKPTAAEEALKIAHLTDGSLGKALLLLNDSATQEQHNILLSLLRSSRSDIQQLETLQDLLDEEGSKKQKQVELIFSLLWFWHRDLHIHHRALHGVNPLLSEYKEAMKRSPPLDLSRLEKLLEEMKLSLERGGRLSHALELFLLSTTA